MKKRPGLNDRGLSRKSRQRPRPSLERFEPRILMAVFDVTNTSDSINAVAGDGSLRGEIMASNAAAPTAGAQNIIDFQLPAGLQTITTVAPLPALTVSTFIDGSTANGFTNKPLIQIYGAAGSGPGLSVSSGAVDIQDLIIDGFNGDGIDLDGQGGDVVAGCYIGTNPTGSAATPNTGIGIYVDSPNNDIGNSGNGGFGFSELPNVISGNSVGIQITGSGDTENDVTNNFVGTDATGKIALGNRNYGIEVNTGGATTNFGATGNTIGGLSGGGFAGNLISGNTAGLDISGNNANRNLVIGNFIGTTITGLAPLPNLVDGIDLNGVSQTTIGGTTSGAGNVISGNGADGVQISASTSILNVIEGNDIGVGTDGSTSIGNGTSGVVINGASENTVGGFTGLGLATTAGNIIANNGLSSINNYGVEVLGGSNDGILTNSIYNNGGLGIKLNGANGGTTPPTLTTVESGAGQTQIIGKYTGIPNDTYDLQFFSNQTPNPSGAGDGQTFIGDYSITLNNQGFAAFTALFTTAVPVGQYVSATATQGIEVTNNTSQFSTNLQDIQAPVTDLSVTTSVPTTPPLFDQPYVYTVTVKNNGPNDDTGVVLTDTIPTTSTFVSTSSGTQAGGVVTDDIGDLASGASEVVTITVTPNSLTGAFTNVATVSGDGLDPNEFNNTVITTGTVAADSDLAVLITPAFTGTTIPIGAPVTYAITVSNYGPSSDFGVVTSISLPANFTNVTVVPDQGTYTIDSSNNITVNTGILGVSGSTTILVTGTPEATGTALVTASVTSGQADPNTNNNSASNIATVSNAADLGVGIDASPDPVLIGNELIYTLTVTNNGPSAASEPVVSDPLPSGVTYVPGDSSAGGNGTLSFAGGTVTANLDALLPGGVDTVTIAVIPTVSGQITNTVTVGDPTLANSVEIDTNPDNNTASVTTQVSPADIAVAINNPADPLFIGTQAVFQVVVTNNGPAPATDVLFTDTFGAGATILNTSAGTISGNTISGNLGTLASGASETITIEIDPTVSGTLLDAATVSSDELDPDTNNNTASSSNLVSPVDLSLNVTPSASSVLIGQPVTYTIQVENAGPATATNVLFTDTLPANIILGSITSSQGTLVASGTTISGNLGSIGSGGFATITFTLTPTVVESVVNTATVASDDIDTNAANNTVTTTISAINLAGSLEFGSSLELVPENSGTVTLTLNRTNGTLGAVTVDYATSDYTALAGVNYVASTGTVSFADGQTTATITIPVLNDGIVDGPNLGFFVTLSNATGGASIGTPSTTGVLVTNTDFDTIPPDVTSLIAIPNGNSLNGFVVTFDKAMAFEPVTNLNNYHLFVVNTNGTQTPVPIAGLQYNLDTFAITIVPTAPLPGNHFYRVVVNGSSGDPLTDLSGNVLFGSDGPGTNYDAIYGQGTNLTYDDALGNQVNIKISGGGTLGAYLAANGEAEAVNLYGVVPGKTKLSGSVTKLSKKATGFTTIGTIDGFGEFGDVYSTLTTPAFYVGSDPVSISALKAEEAAASVKSVTTSPATVVKKTVTAKTKTPKGPKVKLA